MAAKVARLQHHAQIQHEHSNCKGDAPRESRHVQRDDSDRDRQVHQARRETFARHAQHLGLVLLLAHIIGDALHQPAKQ